MSKLTQLFNNLCCKNCNSDFDEDFIQIVRQEPSLFVVKIVCSHCQKDFGIAFLAINENCKTPLNKRDALEFEPSLNPITADDVLDAHKFIKRLDKHWQKYLPPIN